MPLPLPSSQCKDAGTASALRTAITGIAECLPDATEVQTAADTVTVCSSFYAIFLAWITVIWKAICYLFTQITTSSEDITALEADVATNTADIAALEAAAPPVHTGTPTISAGAAAGTGPTFTLLAGSTDTQGAVDVALGTAPTAAGGNMFSLQFGTPFAAQIFPVACARVGGPQTAAGLIVNTFETGSAPVTACAIIVHSPTSVFLAGQAVRVSYHIGFTA